MARILYGVAGEGSGHSSRAKIIIEHLIGQGHEVVVVSHDKGYENLKNFFDVRKISGMRLVYKDNAVKYIPTVFKNVSKIPANQKSLRLIFKIIKEFRPQVVFSDFEPLTALAANLYRLPLISIDNQHQLTNTKLEVPRGYKEEALIAKTISRLMVFNADAYLVTSFFKTNVKSNNTFLFPPILRQEVLSAKTHCGNTILVYVTSNFEQLLPILENIDANFIVYGYNIDKVTKNLTFKKASREGFLKDLSECCGVIATAGASLISEALYLGKPYLALPIKKQFEQILNAYYLEKLGYGSFMLEVDRQGVKDFLSNLPSYEKNLVKYTREGNSKIFKKIDKLLEKFC